MNVTGNAVYYGTSGNSVVPVAGGTVTLTSATGSVNTTTDIYGNYSFALTNVTCGGTF